MDGKIRENAHPTALCNNATSWSSTAPIFKLYFKIEASNRMRIWFLFLNVLAIRKIQVKHLVRCLSEKMSRKKSTDMANEHALFDTMTHEYS